MRILAIDPSGNFSDREGKGTTGIARFEYDKVWQFGRVEAEDFSSMESYWFNVWRTVNHFPMDVIVCESYKLQPSKAGAQSYSSLETPQLIGYLRMMAWEKGIEFVLQDPSIKQRFTDAVLVNTGVATKKGRNHLINGQPSVIHERDAIRHGLHYLRYGAKK
jgi:hypothetical protein